jgi:hypothetical protein
MIVKLQSLNNIPQQSIPMSNDDNDIKIKTIYNSSFYTSSSLSDGDNNLPEIFNHYQKNRLPTEKEEDPEEDIYSLPTF